MGNGDCVTCMSRVPYATLIASIMCCIGVGVFCGTMYHGVTVTLRTLPDIFYFELPWLDVVKTVLIIIGAAMGGLGLLLLMVGFLATGSTREKVYKRWKARLGGRISCAILMVITYILNLCWMGIFVCLIIVSVGFTLAWCLCVNTFVDNNAIKCINLTQFSFLFPNNTSPDSMNLCTQQQLQTFCKKFVEPVEMMVILASVSVFLVVLSLVHYLACLSANYAHIKDHEKFEDLQELQLLHEHEMGHLPKDRF